ncbi:MAG TPA: c-type cytochrome [Verrucomicrobiales bacterium]|nr:c-type cytochrome [Verrucomicrobiales bacterium]HIL68766.1 c-type cytochrome [Verrucomicrobiota bacterium]
MKGNFSTPWYLSALLVLFTFLQAERIVFSQDTPPPGASQSTLDSAREGHGIFAAHCVPCHQKGAAGLVGFAPNIRNRDFLAIASDQYIQQTIKEGRPGTAMVARPDLTDEQIDQLIAYLRSFTQKTSVKNIPLDVHHELLGNRESGKNKFLIFCSACHGPYGEGYRANVPGTGIGLPGFLSVASDKFILKTLTLGRIGTPMQPFIGARGLANLSNQDAVDIIAHLRHLGETYAEREVNQPVGPGNPNAGKVHFNINCAACHQTGGIGKVGFAPSISNRDFLAISSDEFIKTTISIGRAGTGMLPRPDLPEQTVNDIIAYLRNASSSNAPTIELDPDRQFHGDSDAGKATFSNYCAACHGPNGEGYVIGVPGPAIGLEGFLGTASDDYIFQTLKLGRGGTPMRSFLGARGLANLEEKDLHDVIAYLRMLENTAPAEAAEESSDFE